MIYTYTISCGVNSYRANVGTQTRAVLYFMFTRGSIFSREQREIRFFVAKNKNKKAPTKKNESFVIPSVVIFHTRTYRAPAFLAISRKASSPTTKFRTSPRETSQRWLWQIRKVANNGWFRYDTGGGTWGRPRESRRKTTPRKCGGIRLVEAANRVIYNFAVVLFSSVCVVFFVFALLLLAVLLSDEFYLMAGFCYVE